MSRIHLTIDRLVLKGLPQGHDKLLEEALRTQLTQALSDRKARTEWARSHRTPVLKLGRVPLDSGSTGARKLGTQIARGIGRGLRP
jgi:hypothetical protein